MDMDQAAVFLAGSILTALGFIVVVAAIVVVNNIIHKYWKPVRVFTSDSWAAINPPHRFASADELVRVAPSLEETNESKNQATSRSSQK
jgi:uncharacterized protein (DUF58 family)